MIKTEKYQLSLDDTSVLKGIAILAIVIHNFCHWLPNIITENQHTFQIGKSCHFIESALQGGSNLWLNLFSHFGHYGVPVFVFLSGYGLVIKYEKSNIQSCFRDYIKKHVGKLWILLLPLLIFHFLFLAIRKPEYFLDHIDDFGLMISFLGNLNPNPYIFLGPWWFFSLIVQLYIIYYIFVLRHSLKPIIILTFICMIGQVMAIAFGKSLDDLEYLRFNFVGSLLPFLLGIISARKKYFPSNYTAIMSFVLFVICCFNIYLWLLTFGLITIAILPLIKLTCLNSRIHSYFVWIGSISAFIFVIHPMARSVTFELSKYSICLSILGYLILSMLFAYGYKVLLKKIARNWVKRIS